MMCKTCGEELVAVMRTDDHVALPFVRRGRYCEHCGKLWESIEVLTGLPWHKRDTEYDKIRSRKKNRRKH